MRAPPPLSPAAPPADRLAVLAEGLDLVVWEADAATGRYTYVSPAAERLAGYPVARWREEREFWRVLVPAGEQEGVGALPARPAGGREGERELSLATADGRLRRVRETWRVVPDADGRPRRLVGTLQPVGGPAARPPALGDPVAVETVPHVVFRTDAHGAWVFLNAAWTDLTGFPVEACLGRSFLDYVHPEDRDRHAQLFQPLVDGTTEYLGREVRYRTRIGSLRWVEVRAQPVIRGSVILGVSGTLTDVTERKQVEEALLAARSRLRHLLVSSPTVIYSRDAGGDFGFTFVSDNVARRFGIETAELLAHADAWEERVHPDDAAAVRAALASLQADGQGSVEYRIRHADGSYRWVHDERQVVRAAPGGPAEIVGSWLEVTALRQAEATTAHLEGELRQAQKMEAVGRLAGGVAHDFNNHLTVITGRCELLARRLGSDHPQARDVETVLSAARRAANLTAQLLAFSRKQVLQPRRLDLNAVMGGLKRMLERLIGEDVTLLTVADPALGRVRADRGQLEQVLMNLTVNARHAMPDGGRLTLETANVQGGADGDDPRVPAGGWVRLTVSDTGCGMDAETQTKIFEPFFTTKPPDQGTGLGLSTVYGIVKQSGGEIAVESERDRGATFRIYLPRIDEPADPETSAAPPRTPGGSETILLAEDEACVRDLARDVLRASGYTVLEAARGEEALQVARAHPGPIHLLMTDVIMPGMNGRELSERLVASRPELRVLYVSGYTDDAIVQHGIEADRAAFLPKPFTVADITTKIREVLDQARAGAPQ